MRRLLSIVLLFACFIPVIRSQEYKNFRDLEKGDWMLLEMAEYYPYVAPGLVEEVPWRAENIRRSIFRATVIDITNENITLEYRLESIYDCRNIEGEDRFLYYESAYEEDLTQSPFHSSSDFSPWRIVEAAYSDNEKVLATATYGLKSGELLELNNTYKNQYVVYSRKPKSIGLLNEESVAYSTSVAGFLNTARVITKGMNLLIKHNDGGKLITISVRQRPEVLKTNEKLEPFNSMSKEQVAEQLIPCEIRLVGASFQLPSNVKLIYSDTDSINKATEAKIRKFFIPYPTRYFLDKDWEKYYPWLISPGDSIVRNIQENKPPYFTGRGSEQNNFYYRNRHLNSAWATDMETGKYSEVVLDKFLSGTTGFWRRSFQLDMLYGLVSGDLLNPYFNRVLDKNYAEINWKEPYYREIIPLTDGWYKFDSFESFLNSYMKYKSTQSATETLNTVKFYYEIDSQVNKKRNYYLNKHFLEGYPRQFVNARILISMMNENFLSESNTEYHDFISHCPDQELLKEVICKHQQLEQLEKGKNIMETDLTLVKELFSQNKNKKYILIYMNPSHQSKIIEDFYAERLYKKLEQRKLLSETNILFVNPEEPETDTDNDTKIKERLKQFFIHPTQNDIRDELSPYNNKSICILMRNDGTIISRVLHWILGIHSDEVATYIEEDMNRGQSDYTKGFRKGLLGTLVAGFFVLLFLKIYWDRKRKKEKEERQIKELELKAIRSQMNPHFIFNALGSIQNLLGKGANDEANDYLVRFSRLLRTVLNNSEKKLVPLSGEIEQLYLYLALEQLRFPFIYSIEIDDALETDLIEIPGMLIQPFVENAVKHAIAPRGTGKINIIINQTDNILHVTIQDDGPGLSSTASGGFGIQAVKDEIGILKNLYHTDIEINIINRQDNEPCTGVKVMLAIPIG